MLAQFARASWTHQPLNGGFVYSIASCGNKLFASTQTGTWCSTDSGASWSSVSNGAAGLQAYSIAVIGNDMYEILSATQLVHSSDAGTTWSKLSTNLVSNYVSITSAGSNLLLSTQQGLYRSMDKGATWTMPDAAPSGYVEYLTADSNIVFAGSMFAIFMSTDFGAHWSPWDTGYATYSTRMFGVWRSKTTIFIATDQGICGSLDNGRTWLPSFTFWADGWNIASVARIGSTMFVTAARNSYSNYEKLCIVSSRDDGATWQADSTSFCSPGVTVLYNFHNIFIAGTYGGGIYRSLDTGRSWKESNDGMMSAEVMTLASANNTVLAGCGGSLQRSTDKGATWHTSIHDFNAYELFVNRFVKHSSYLFAATYAGVYRSSNNGTTWNSLADSMPGYGYSYLTTLGNCLFAGGSSALMMSTDDGLNWTWTGTYAPSFGGTALLAISDKIIMGGQGGASISSDTFKTWLPLFIGRWNGTVHDFEYSNGNAVAATDSGVFVSPDSGFTWNDINDRLPSYEDISAVAIRDSNIFVALDHRTFIDSNTTAVDPRGLFLSTDLGTTWQSIADNLPHTFITAILVDSENVYVGLNGEGSGVWARSLSELPISAVQPVLIYPQEDALLVPTNVNAQWSPASSAIRYHVQLATDISFEKPALDSSTANTHMLFSNLASNRKYYWHIMALRSAGDSVQSSIGTFTTGTASGVPEDVLSAHSFVMPIISPSPATQVTTIAFVLPFASHVSLELCDMAGRVVRAVCSGYFQQGTTRRTVDVSALPSNTYFCRLSSDGGTVVTKFSVAH